MRTHVASRALPGTLALPIRLTSFAYKDGTRRLFFAF